VTNVFVEGRGDRSWVLDREVVCAVSKYDPTVKSPSILTLVFAVGLSFFLHDPVDAGIILIIVLITILYIFMAEVVKKVFYRRLNPSASLLGSLTSRQPSGEE